MRHLLFATVSAAAVLALSACEFDSAAPAPAPVPLSPPVSKPLPPPAPPPPAPEPEKAATDNCGPDPADMDYKTKVQCGLVEETESESATESETETETTPECGEGNVLVPDSPIGPYCDYAGTGEEEQSTEPSSEYEQYQQDTGYPYSEEQYDELPGYQQCGTACGKEPTSGETQLEYLCQQGIVTEGC